MFLHKSDYSRKIHEDDLNVIIDEDDDILFDAELETQKEISSYLASRFDVSKIFDLLQEYDFADTYQANDLIILVAAEWKSGKTYVADNIVLYEGYIYKNISGTAVEPPTNATNWTQMAKQYAKYTSVDSNNTGNHVDDTAHWKAGDIRDALVKRHFIDITLYEIHSRINPRNIPALRVKRRDDAVEYLKAIADPRKNITPDLPLKQFDKQKGNDATWGANDKVNHGQNTY